MTAAGINVPIRADGLDEIRADPAKASQLLAAATSFRQFVNHWRFLDQESGVVRSLGEVIWEAQEMFCRAVEEARWVYFLKARKLGETTIECAYDGWVMRFRDANGRVHLFSRRDDAAMELLQAVRFGLRRLPEWMRLPEGRSTTHEFELIAGEDDRRLAKAYPANEETAVEATCTHGHVDEWARMRNPRKVWQAIEASMADTCHIVTTGLGPTNYSSEFWRRSVAGETAFLPFFVDALRRPDRSEAWLAAKRRSFPRQSDAKQEYPMTPEDAMAGDGGYYFEDLEVDRATDEALGPSPPIDGHTYVNAWDVGRTRDAAVGVTIDVTSNVMDVVRYERHIQMTYPSLQRLIEEVHRQRPGLTVIEANSAGQAVAENLELAEGEVELFTTSAPSKAKILAMLKGALQNEMLKFDGAAWPQMESEVRGYKLPDDDIVQDTVIALAIGNAHAALARTGGRRSVRGRVGRIVQL